MIMFIAGENKTPRPNYYECFLLPVNELDFDVFVIIFEQPGKLNADCLAKGFVFNILDEYHVLNSAPGSPGCKSKINANKRKNKENF